MQDWASLIDLSPWMVLVPTVALLAAGLTPAQRANRHASRVGRIVTLLSQVQLLAAGLIAVLWFANGRPSRSISVFSLDSIPLLQELGFLLNGPTVVMFSLISFISWVITRYSLQYLDGDSQQGRFFKQLSFTIGCVNLLVWSSSLVMFTAAWFGVSLGLHALLLHFGHRSGAKRAAWLKFTVSRSGELILVAAVAVLLSAYGTTEFSAIGALSESIASQQSNSAVSSSSLSIACWLVVVAAIVKTAQFPFHAWLPQTLETPTPVSALMHAGVVNAGGFLMIRSGGWFASETSPLILLTLAGTVTAVYGAVVMSTQSSIKRQLAYSTVAQMGFMMLQCGLGSFSSAMLHILAHSLYKAHAFLASGTVLQERQATEVTQASEQATAKPWKLELISTVPAALALFATGLFVLSTVATNKAGAVPLLTLWLIGIGYYIATAIKTWNLITFGRSFLIAAFLTNVYACSLWMVQQVFVNASTADITPSPWSLLIVLCGFSTLVVWQIGLVQWTAKRMSKSHWYNAFYIHAVNGFYLEAIWRRIAPTRSVSGS